MRAKRTSGWRGAGWRSSPTPATSRTATTRSGSPRFSSTSSGRRGLCLRTRSACASGCGPGPSGLLRLLLLEHPRHQHTQQIERTHRQRESALRGNVGRGRDERGDDEDDEDGVTELREEPLLGHDAHAREEEDEDRRLENEPHAEEQLRRDVEVVLDLQDGHEVLARGHEELRNHREAHRVAEVPAAHEKEHGQKDERPHPLPLVAVEARRDEEPELVEDHGARHEHARQEGDVDVEHEGLGELRVRELRPGWQGRENGRLEPLEDLLRFPPAQEEADRDREGRDEEPLAEVLEMLEERHPRELFLSVFPSRCLFGHDGVVGVEGGTSSAAFCWATAPAAGAMAGSSGFGSGFGGSFEIESRPACALSISSWIERLRSFEARLNSPSAFPTCFPISGSFFGPKRRSARNMIIMSSGMPRLPIEAPPARERCSDDASMKSRSPSHACYAC